MGNLLDFSLLSVEEIAVVASRRPQEQRDP